MYITSCTPGTGMCCGDITVAAQCCATGGLSFPWGNAKFINDPEISLSANNSNSSANNPSSSANNPSSPNNISSCCSSNNTTDGNHPASTFSFGAGIGIGIAVAAAIVTIVGLTVWSVLRIQRTQTSEGRDVAVSKVEISHRADGAPENPTAIQPVASQISELPQ
jgi:hypothetical protein